ncbi:cytosol aminopeptidase-like isoform X2 [Hyposmocoma kahamanoa]|uniref:cytosol aminopeptidase-like isoform X2 n=1 Tax=Hyposmocoma kahamanoa TaxID=1477025 RepID=UPI000E6DA1F5|nr:cytosol aminopeptidase-like isoform X2 [Hyposmocoma kahamanoa]
MGFSKLLYSVRLAQSTINLSKSVFARQCSSSGFSETCVCPGKDSGEPDGLVLGVYESKDGSTFELTEEGRQIDQKSAGKLCRHVSEMSCELKPGVAFVLTDLAPDLPPVTIASFGKRDVGYNHLENINEAKENVRVGVGAGVRELLRRGAQMVSVDPGYGQEDAAAEAAMLASWRFQEFKSCENREPEMKVKLAGSGKDADKFHLGELRGRAQNWARYLSDMPANHMTPVQLAQAALDVLCPLGVKISAHDVDWIRTQRMEAFLAVARGSCEDPYFLEATWEGPDSKNRPPVLLAAKGVTFDSGGLCLKRPANMVENRGSMAGAACVLATLRYIAEIKMPIKVTAVIPICENMISGQCMKVGDVVKTLNGLHVTIENTDMEGRLMLADALVYGQAVYKPSLVIDVATLTHGVLLATGGGAFGAFATSEEAWGALRHAGADSGDRPWRFPLWKYYLTQVTNEAAVDLRNQGSGRSTPCLGAAFLSNFVCCDWLHLDITGVAKLAHSIAPPYLDPLRMTGRPARALMYLLHDLSLSSENVSCDADRR